LIVRSYIVGLRNLLSRLGKGACSLDGKEKLSCVRELALQMVRSHAELDVEITLRCFGASEQRAGTCTVMDQILRAGPRNLLSESSDLQNWARKVVLQMERSYRIRRGNLFS